MRLKQTLILADGANAIYAVVTNHVKISALSQMTPRRSLWYSENGCIEPISEIVTVHICSPKSFEI